ncbi:aldehyde ferredoxin oxidoreductase C-terminal domain-containing protein, partial [Chloroflexota bacterium]
EKVLVNRRGCFACPIRCKPEVASGAPYNVDPTYGGPEYEAIGSFGSNCGIDDIEAVSKANELSNAYGLDVISAGVSISFAMECFEKGILTEKDTGGIDLNFGNGQAMVQMVEMIARKEGLGAILADGVARAAAAIGNGAEEFAMHANKQEFPMHSPRFRPGMGVGYAVSPTGADHCHNMWDNQFSQDTGRLKDLGIIEPLPTQELSPAKVRMLVYGHLWPHILNCLDFCSFVPLSSDRMLDLIHGITGWKMSEWELNKVGERCITMARVFNVRAGRIKSDDSLPGRFFTPFDTGPLEGVSLDEAAFNQAVSTYYAMLGWDDEGRPTSAKLQELGVGWIVGT